MIHYVKGRRGSVNPEKTLGGNLDNPLGSSLRTRYGLLIRVSLKVVNGHLLLLRIHFR